MSLRRNEPEPCRASGVAAIGPAAGQPAPLVSYRAPAVGRAHARRPAPGRRTDQFLVRQARAGITRAFDELVIHYYAPILRYLVRRTGDTELAADLTQETFLDAWRHLWRLPDDREFAPWLYRIARNNLLPEWRRRRPVSLDNLATSGAPPPPALRQADPAPACQQRALVTQVLREVGPAHRQVLLLYAAHDYSCTQIADLLGLSFEAARKRVRRAKLAFRRRYAAADAIPAEWEVQHAGSSRPGC